MEPKDTVDAYVKFDPKLYVHIYKHVCPIKHPFEVKGQQGFFNIDIPMSAIIEPDGSEEKSSSSESI